MEERRSRKSDAVSYLAPGAERAPVSASGTCFPLVNASTPEIRGTVAPPHFPCGDADRYASIHSNPPGIETEFAGLTVNRFGKGRCIYLYSAFLIHGQCSQRKFGMNLFAPNVPVFLVSSENLQQSTKITLLKSTTSPAYLLGIVNCQDELPNIPLHDLKLSFRLPEHTVPEKLFRAPDGQTMNFRFENGILRLAANAAP